MAANTNPIFSRTADIQWAVSMLTANNNLGLDSGTSYLAFTADATEGGFVREARFKPAPGASQGGTVWRVWINNGGSLAVRSNSVLFGELSIPATSSSAINGIADFIMTLNISLPPAYRIYFTIGTAPGGSGEYYGCVIGGKY